MKLNSKSYSKRYRMIEQKKRQSYNEGNSIISKDNNRIINIKKLQ